LDAFIDQYGLGLGHGCMPESGIGTYVGGTPAKAPAAMLQCIQEREELGEATPYNQVQIERLEKRFLDAQATGCGMGDSGPYTRMWKDGMGWMTNTSDQILLRFDQPADREGFRSDLLDHPERLLHPLGVNPSMSLSKKHVAVSGSMPPVEWDDSLVWGVMRLGLPIFFLPHVVKEPLMVSGRPEFALLTIHFRNSPVHFGQPVVAPIHLPAYEYCWRYQKILRQRLHLLPGGYELSVLRIIHELEDVCYRIAHHSATPGSSGEEIMTIFMTLHTLTFRGIVLSIASMAYHCLGFDPGCPRHKALALMRLLRDKGPLTRRDLQRGVQSFTATGLDKVLTRLAAEGLVKVNGKEVTAVPLAEFAEALHARPEFL
ncbi:MAG: hypothetical protein ACRDBP_01710, partial [Luteolibacter sp.]